MPKKSTSYRPFRALSRPETGKKAPRTFEEVMARAGTVPLVRGVGRVPPQATRTAAAPIGERPVFAVETDDEFVAGQRADLPRGARARLGGTPTATLDLHRNDAVTARRRVARFLADERALGQKLVLIIVGRGRHSPDGRGVLRAEVADWLTTPPASAHVLAFRTAPRELGGSGAVVVLLAPVRSRSRPRRAG